MITRDKYLTSDEVNLLEMSFERYARSSPRDVLFLRLLLETGARASEALALTGRDVNTTTRSIYLRGVKGSFDREIPLRETTCRSMEALLHENHPLERRLFPFSYPRAYQIWQMYRPVRKKLHSLRHTFAIELYRRTRDLKLVQLALGHRSINSTMVYLNFQYSVEELRKVIA